MPKVATMVSAASVVAIVRGRVSDVAWERDGTLARTAYHVDISQTYKGAVARTILVREDGGYLSAADVQGENQDKFPGTSQPASGYIDVTFEGAPHPQVGDEVVLFLQPDPNPGHESAFVLVGSSFGRFVLRGDTYQRAAVAEGWESSLAQTSLASTLAR